MAKQLVTIDDIASRLDVSKATVSYVLSGKAEAAGVSKARVEQVLRVAEQLGYVPNRWAKALRANRTKMISVIFWNLEMGWSQRVMEGVEQCLLKNDYTVAIYAHTFASSCDEHFLKLEEKKIYSILERRDEGVICQLSEVFKHQYRQLLSAGLPMVLLNEVQDMSGFERADRVLWDSAPAAQTAVRFLLGRGYRRIGYIGLQLPVRSCQERYQAYVSTMQQAGIDVAPEWVINPDPGEGFYPSDLLWKEQAKAVLSQKETARPEAFFVMNDRMAVHLIDIIRNLGLRIPQDVGLIGMGELDVTFAAGLTTMREPLTEMGKRAAEILLARIENPKMPPVQERIICNDLIIRSSTR